MMTDACPTCATAREGSDRYCPNCGYDFETGESLVPVESQALGPGSELVVVLSLDGRRPNDPGCEPPPEDQSQRIFALDGRSLVIGRADSGDLQIPIRGDPYVSRRHAEMIELGAGWGIRDLGSTNGTKVNGVPIEGAEIKVLRPDDVVEVGCFARLTVQHRSGLEPGISVLSSAGRLAGAGDTGEGPA